MRRKLNVRVVQSREELLDLISFHQKSNTVKTHSNLWRRVLQEYPEFNNKSCHWEYEGITQELHIREGTSKSWWFNFKF